MKQRYIPLLLTLLVLSACNPRSAQQTQEEPTTMPQQTEEVPTMIPGQSPTEIVSGAPTIEPTRASLQLAVHPPETRTGMDELDAIIDGVLAHDMAVLRSLMEYTVVGCTKVMALGGPPECAPNEDESDLVEVVPILGPEGHHMRPADFEQWAGPDVRGLLAAYRVSSDTYSDEAYPAGEVAIVFLNADGISVVTLQVLQGRVIRFDFRMGGSIESDLDKAAEEFILPLSFQPIPTQVSWNQFTDPKGRFSLAYPPTMSLAADAVEDAWTVGDRIQISVHPFDKSWVACFDQALGDCPVVETDENVIINGLDVRRVKGYIGAIGGRIPQEFLVYLFHLDEQVLDIVLYALPFDAESDDVATIRPLEGEHLELFDRMVETVTLGK